MSKDSKYMGIGEASKYLGVSPTTLRRWEASGVIAPSRTPTNIRLYTKEQLDNVLTRPTRQ